MTSSSQAFASFILERELTNAGVLSNTKDVRALADRLAASVVTPIIVDVIAQYAEELTTRGYVHSANQLRSLILETLERK